MVEPGRDKRLEEDLHFEGAEKEFTNGSSLFSSPTHPSPLHGENKCPHFVRTRKNVHIFRMLISHQICDLQIFFPILWVVISLCPLMHKSFKILMQSKLSFFILLLVLFVSYSRTCQIQYHETFLLCSSKIL